MMSSPRCWLVLGTLLLFLFCQPLPLSAVEDFRDAIRSAVPKIVLVRCAKVENAEPGHTEQEGLVRPSQGTNIEDNAGEVKEKVATDVSQAVVTLQDVVEEQDSANDYQHALRVSDNLIATVDLNSQAENAKWELLSRNGMWHDLQIVGRDKTSSLIILRASVDVLDSISASAPLQSHNDEPKAGDDDAVGPPASIEMGLPAVVVWYEAGAPRAKSTMVAATGNIFTRGLARLDNQFKRNEIGAPVLDADGRLLGILSSENRTNDSQFSLDAIDVGEIAQQAGGETVADQLGPASTAATLVSGSRPTSIIITRNTTQAEADLVIPAVLVNRVVEDVKSADSVVVLEPGLIGVRLGNGDATIRRVIAGGAVAEQNCKPGDRITSINGSKIFSDSDIMNVLSAYRAGDQVTLEVMQASTEGDAPTEPRKFEITMRGYRTRSRN